MKALLVWLGSPSRYAAFHALTFACAVTGGFVLLSAGGLGPLAPLLLAMGLYLILFAALAQCALGVGRVAAAVVMRLRPRTGEAAAS